MINILKYNFCVYKHFGTFDILTSQILFMIDSIFKILFNLITNNKFQKIFFAVSFIGIFVLMYLLNRFYPLFADDWNYSFVWGSDAVRVEGICDIIKSQYNHYFTWGGRIVTHFIAQSLLLLDPVWHDIMNTLAFVIFIYIIYRISNYNCKANFFILILIFLFVWFFQPAFGATLLWITGSSNYLWGTLLILIFVFPYYSFYRNPDYRSEGFIACLCIFLIGIVAGWTNENMSVASIFLIFLFCIIYKKRGKLPAWAIYGLIGVCIGCILLLVAPGNYVRLENARESFKEPDISFFEILISRASLMFSHYVRYILPLIVLYIILFFVVKKLSDNSEKKKILFVSFIFVLTSHVAFFAMIASPQFPIRALFGIITFLIIAIVILCANLNVNKILNVIMYMGIFILLLPFGYDYYHRYKVLEYASNAWKQRNEYVLKEKAKGNLNIIIKDKIMISHIKYHLYELPDNNKEWQNQSYSHFYGVDSIKVID